MTFQCSYCSRIYSNAYGLKRHISDKYQFINDQEKTISLKIPLYEEPDLWDEEFTLDYSEDQIVR